MFIRTSINNRTTHNNKFITYLLIFGSCSVAFLSIQFTLVNFSLCDPIQVTLIILVYSIHYSLFKFNSVHLFKTRKKKNIFDLRAPIRNPNSLKNI